MIEIITIYLAAGAPFGVSYFLRKPRKRGASSLLKAASAALLWPLSAATVFLAHRRRPTLAAVSDSAPGSEPDALKIEQARRQLIGALYKVEELARASSDKEGKRTELVAYMVRESVEKYTGLMLCCSSSCVVATEAAPLTSEMELCRIAGRTGADLLLAGRCIHRRNVARLLAHRERARTSLLHALAEVRELSPEVSATAQRNIAAARHTSVAILRFYAHAVNLLSLLEDETAARTVARLLDAECARLRRLENYAGEERAPEEAAAKATAVEEEEEEACRPHVPHLAFIGPSPTGTLPQG